MTTIGNSAYSVANQDSSFALYNNIGVAQSFHNYVSGDYLRTATFHLSKTGSPTGTAVAKLYNVTGTIGSTAAPTGSPLAVSDSFDISLLTTTLTLVTFNFDQTYQMAVDDYAITVELTGTFDVNNRVNVGADATSPTHAGNPATYNGSTWTASSATDVIHGVFGTLGTTIDMLPPEQAVTTVAIYGGRAVSQSFTTGSVPVMLSTAEFQMSKTSTPSGYMYAYVYPHSGVYGTSSVPTGSPIAISDPVTAQSLDTTLTTTTFTFRGGTVLDANTNYCLVVAYSGGTSSLYANVGYQSAYSVHSGNRAFYNGSSWATSATSDVAFEIAGVTASSTHSIDAFIGSGTASYAALNDTVTRVGQSFTWTRSAATLTAIAAQISKTNSPTGSIYAKLYAHSGTYGTSSVATGSALATSNAIDVSTITTSTPVTFTFTDAYKPTFGTQYVLSFEYTGGSATNYLNVKRDATSPNHSGNYCEYTTAWTATSGTDLQFIVTATPPAETFVTSYARNNIDTALGIGNPAARIGMSQSFTWGVTETTLKRIVLELERVGSPTGSMYAKLYAHSGTYGTSSIQTGSPLATSSAIDTSLLLATPSYVEFIFDGSFTPVNGTNYVLAVEYSGGDSSNYVQVHFDNSTPSHSGNAATLLSSTWTAQSYDMVFEVYGTGSKTGSATSTTTEGATVSGTRTAVTSSTSTTTDGATVVPDKTAGATSSSTTTEGGSVTAIQDNTTTADSATTEGGTADPTRTTYESDTTTTTEVAAVDASSERVVDATVEDTEETLVDAVKTMYGAASSTTMTIATVVAEVLKYDGSIGFGAATERIYQRLPMAFRTYDTDRGWILKQFISSIALVLDDLDILYTRFDYTSPDEGGVNDRCDLTSVDYSDPEWLPWIAYVAGVPLDTSLSVAEQRAQLNARLTRRDVGSKRSIIEAARSVLTGSQTVNIYPRSTSLLDRGTQTEWDLLIVTYASETSSDPIQAVIDAGCKPAGVILHHETAVTTWDDIQTTYTTWADMNDQQWSTIHEAGF